MAEPVEYRNERGKQMWQPCTHYGDRLWWGRSWGGEMSGEHTEEGWAKTGHNEGLPYPKLYRSRRRAERVARREERRLERIEMDETFKEVRRGG